MKLLALAFLAAAAFPGTARAAEEIPITTSSPAALQAFREGRLKALNFEDVAAAALLRKAIAADPDFALAYAWLARVTPGPEGLRYAGLATAADERSGKVAPLERLGIQVLIADRTGDEEMARKLKRGLADEAPGDWFAQYQQGVQAFYDHKSQAALIYLKRALQLNPDLAEAYNYLGTVYVEQGQNEQGISMARKFVELRPKEPNAWDSLGETLLRVGKYPEAEEAFLHAVSIGSSDEWTAYAGVGYSRFFRGDAKEGRVFLEKGRKLAVRPEDRRAISCALAWSLLAAGQADAAFKELDAIERDPKRSEFVPAWVALERAEMLFELGRADDARAKLSVAREPTGRLSPGERKWLLRNVLVLQARLGAQGHRPSEVREALTQLQKELDESPSNAVLRDRVHHVAGLLAASVGDTKEAVAQMTWCSRLAVLCQMDLFAVRTQSGATAAAAEVRRGLLASNLRDPLHRGEDPVYLFVRSKLDGASRRAP